MKYPPRVVLSLALCLLLVAAVGLMMLITQSVSPVPPGTISWEPAHVITFDHTAAPTGNPADTSHSTASITLTPVPLPLPTAPTK